MGRQKRFEVVVDAWNGSRGKCFRKIFFCLNIAGARTKAEAYLDELMDAYSYDEWEIAGMEELFD